MLHEPLIAIFRPVLRHTVRRVLVGRSRSRSSASAGRFTRAEADSLLEETLRRFARLAGTRPPQPTMGARQNVLLACLTVAFFEALLASGVERPYAIELVGDASWRIYDRWGRLTVRLADPLGGPPASRLRRRVNLFLRYPFGRPGYRRRDREEPQGRAFDILHCPIADFMREQDAADLCVGTWCNLDFPLAEMWGGRLERKGTLAGGARLCDFRFIASSEPPAASASFRRPPQAA